MRSQLQAEEQGVATNKQPKHNFGKEELDNVLLALWTQDDKIFIPERLRVQATLMFHIDCCTGACIEAFSPGQDKDGLRSRVCTLFLSSKQSFSSCQDFTLVLIRTEKRFNEWKLIYWID